MTTRKPKPLSVVKPHRVNKVTKLLRDALDYAPYCDAALILMRDSDGDLIPYATNLNDDEVCAMMGKHALDLNGEPE